MRWHSFVSWCVRHFVHLPSASIGRSQCDVELHLEDHSGGMDRSTRARRYQTETKSKDPLLNWFPSADDVSCWICRISSSANVVSTCGHYRWLGTAFVLCLRWTMEKSVSRKHSGVPFCSVALSGWSTVRSVYNCFTLAVSDISVWHFLFRIVVPVFQDVRELVVVELLCIMVWRVDFPCYSLYAVYCRISVKWIPRMEFCTASVCIVSCFISSSLSMLCVAANSMH